MYKKFVFESLDNYINYKLLLKEAKEEGNAQNKDNNAPWDFKFDSGKFKKDDVTQDQIKKLDTEFKKRIVPLFTNENYIGQILEVNISAASSKVPINPSGSVAKELKSLGYKPNNEGLCEARGNTVVEIIKDLIYDNFGEGQDRESFFKDLSKKMVLVNKPLPNIGPEYNKDGGDNADDQKYKNNQYISASLSVKGDKIPEEKFLTCNSDKSFKGKKASASNGYIGYDETIYIRAKAGQKMTISFDPLVIPDSILFVYSGKEVKLAPFSGSYGAKYVQGKYTKENEAEFNKKANLGYGPKAIKEVIAGQEYLVIDYKDYINNVLNKGGALVKSIENKLRSLGISTIKDICPEFFDSEGKIEVYMNKDLSGIKPEYGDPSKITYDLLKSNKLKNSPKADTKSFNIEITKNVIRDSVTLVAFSPIEGTLFKIKTTCK